MPDLTDRQLATILAALRHFQNSFTRCENGVRSTVFRDSTGDVPAAEMFEHFRDVEPLEPADIDHLCETLNVH